MTTRADVPLWLALTSAGSGLQCTDTWRDTQGANYDELNNNVDGRRAHGHHRRVPQTKWHCLEVVTECIKRWDCTQTDG